MSDRRIPHEDVYFTFDGEVEFDAEHALAALLDAEVVTINAWHWRDHDQEQMAVFSDCSDVFAWGCADAEEVPFHRLQALYDMWHRDRIWGPAVWAMQQRKQMPQPPVEARIRKDGIWDLDSMGLRPNRLPAAEDAPA